VLTDNERPVPEDLNPIDLDDIEREPSDPDAMLFDSHASTSERLAFSREKLE
jgi:hypothetical protein